MISPALLPVGPKSPWYVAASCGTGIAAGALAGLYLTFVYVIPFLGSGPVERMETQPTPKCCRICND